MPPATKKVGQLDRIEADIGDIKTSFTGVVASFKAQSRVLWVMTLALIALAGAEKVLPLIGG